MIARYLVVLAMLIGMAIPTSASLGQKDLDQVAARLGQASGKKFTVEVDPSQELNAWASADSRTGVTQGMLNALATADQLAFVIGHERSHLSAGHHKKQTGQTLLGAILGALAGRVIGNDDDVETGVKIGAGILGAKQSRGDEYKADAAGLKLAVKAGYSPNGGIEALRLLQARYGNGQAGVPIVGWFVSHPVTGNRVSALQKLAATLAPAKPALSNLDIINQILRSDYGLNRDSAFTRPRKPATSL